jgi:O-antigen biosynthesis protein
MEPLVSVIVPTYNRKWLLPRTLRSLTEQSYRNIEIILVNDFGEDVQEVVDKFNDPRIKYFQNTKNIGLASSRNVALRNMNGQYFCLCDDDDVYTKYAIEFRMYMMKKLNKDVVYTRSLLDHWEKRDDGYVSVGKSLYWDCPYFSKDLLLIQNIAPCCNVTVSRKAWEETNYWFDESLTTTEDQDFWTAISRKFDFEDLQVVDTECSQRNDKTQMTNNLDFSKNWIKVFKKWRHTAEDLKWVTESQNNILKRVGINPSDFGL